MKIKTKFNKGDVLYFKYPSRYSRSKQFGTVEAIVKIEAITSDFRHDNDYFYTISLVKVVSAKPGHWTNVVSSDYVGHAFGVDTLELETYSRKLTPAEKVLYG